MASAAAATPAAVESAAVEPAKFEIVVPPPMADTGQFLKFVDADTEGAEEKEIEEEEEEEEEILPAYYSEGTRIPVFTPTMDQFRSFKKFVDNINHYGMGSGIVKIVPPKEWHDSLPPLDEKVRDIKIKNPIEQHIAGSSGEYRQTNVQKQRTYNLPEWRSLCEGSDHQPPARRGERRKGQTQPAVKRNTRTRKSTVKEEVKAEEDPDEASSGKTNPPTPESPVDKVEDATPEPVGGRQPRHRDRTQETPGLEADAPGGRQPRKAAPRRKTAKERAEERELADDIAYEGFDYRISDVDQFTAERCAELEKAYWRTLTYNSPLYGADMPGSLFDERTTSWNVAKLENLLDCLGKKLPGVNTAYLYLGMWKSTFSWHLEDMDLYSINYIHFGAPKQWYSISSEDKAKFEQVMKSIWPNEAKKCSEFLRHKTFLVSPALLSQHGIKVNKLVHRQGEFVITFPFGYHSGYNLGYNCAESVNFATSSWLKFGRDAKKCECVDDSVFVDIDEIERKLAGLPTDDEFDDDDEVEYGYYDEEGKEIEKPGDFPTPPESVDGKPKRGRPRKRKAEDGTTITIAKKPRKPAKTPVREPCVLCPNDIPSEPLLETDNGAHAHKLCALYTPETYFKWDDAREKELVANTEEIPKARLELKCMFCRQKKGSCFQCSAKKCTRAYHATCAAAAGVLVNMVDVQVTGEDGKQYSQTNIDYRCKVHRSKRPKDIDAEALENDPLVRTYSAALIKGDVIQMQYLGGHTEIFAGVVRENRVQEGTVLVQILPRGDILEVEWKWILAQDSSQTDFPDATVTAPMYPNPSYPKRKPKVAQKDILEADVPFGELGSGYTWGELVVGEGLVNTEQEPVKFWWHYLGEKSTEYIPKYTDDPAKRVHNPASSFVPPKPPPRKTYRQSSVHVVQAPGYTMSLPPGYGPQYYNHQLIGYGPGPGPQNQYRQMAPMSPQATPVHSMQSSPHFNHDYSPPASSAERSSSMSFPLKQMFGGEPPQAHSPTRPQSYSPITPVMQHRPFPQHPSQQHPSQQHPSQQQPRYSPSVSMAPPPPTQQQYYSHAPLPQPQLYHSSPMPQSSGFIIPPPQQQQQQQHAPPPPSPPQAGSALTPTLTNAAGKSPAAGPGSAPVSDISAALARLARDRAEKEERDKLVCPEPQMA